MQSSLKFAGQVEIEGAEIVTSSGKIIDVTNQVIGVDFYEDLFAPFITGALFIRDNQDISGVAPLIGEEFLNIKVSTPTLESNLCFNDQYLIYKIEDKIQASDKQYIYQLMFISREALYDMNTSYSKAFSGKISEIAKTIADRMTEASKKKVNIEETANGTKYVSNFWNPTQNLFFLADAAINRNRSPSYVFFENREGFNFFSLESLAWKPPAMMEFVKDNYSRDGANSVRNIQEEYKRIIDYSVDKQFDYMENTRLGVNASSLHTYDLVTKKYTRRSFDVVKDLTNFKTLNDLLPYTTKLRRATTAKSLVDYKHNGVHDNFGDVSNTAIVQSRNALMMLSSATRLKITVPGRTDYTVGMKIYVKLYKLRPTDKAETDVVDEVLSGNYLISAINHHITREGHTCFMEVIKDSYIKKG